MNPFDGDAKLRDLISSDRLADAEKYCESQDPTGSSRWGLLRALVCFLNEMNDDAGYYDRGPAILDVYLAANLRDIDAHFWHAYWSLISRGWSEVADRELVLNLEVAPLHAYSNLGIAAHRTSAGARFHLLRALESQPANIRVLERLAQLEHQEGRDEESARLLRILIASEPYVESNFGIMNEYTNEVLTGASVRDDGLALARETLAVLGRD